MKHLGFEWDYDKAKANIEKHGVSFEEAESVFYDELALVIEDPDHYRGEDRYLIMGRSDRARLLVVCYCYREHEEIIRIISARKASCNESIHYKG